MSVIDGRAITETIAGFKVGGLDASVGQNLAKTMEMQDVGVSHFFDESMATGGGGLDYDQFTDTNNNNFEGFINFDMDGTADGLLFA